MAPWSLPDAATYQDKMARLADANAGMKGFLKDYGLEALADRLWQYIVNNGVEDENRLSLWVAEQPEYRKRFPAMTELQKKGRAISPAQYIQLERSYKQVFQEFGIPAAFYDESKDFTAMIAGEVSPAELQGRVQDGFTKVAQADPAVRDQFRRYFGVEGDVALATFFLDPARALPKLEAAVAAASVAGAANNMNFQLGMDEADRLAKMGVTYEKAMSGFEKINMSRDLFMQSMGDTEVTTSDAPDSALNGFGANAPSTVETVFTPGGDGKPRTVVRQGAYLGQPGETDDATQLGMAAVFGTDGEAQLELQRRLAQRRAAVSGEASSAVVDREGGTSLGSA